MKLFGICFALTSSLAFGGAVSFEGDVLPEEAGWGRVGSGNVDRTLEDRRFVQFAHLPGVLDGYQRPVDGLDIEQPFFLEWRVGTDVSDAALDTSATPVVLSAVANGSS